MYPNLEAELKRHRITRVALAKELGVALSTISQKMSGQSEFTLKMAFKIKDILGIDMSIDYLFAKNDVIRKYSSIQ